jgi:hypothetical protein
MTLKIHPFQAIAEILLRPILKLSGFSIGIKKSITVLRDRFFGIVSLQVLEIGGFGSFTRKGYRLEISRFRLELTVSRFSNASSFINY